MFTRIINHIKWSLGMVDLVWVEHKGRMVSKVLYVDVGGEEYVFNGRSGMERLNGRFIGISKATWTRKYEGFRKPKDVEMMFTCDKIEGMRRKVAAEISRKDVAQGFGAEQVSSRVARFPMVSTPGIGGV